jgi:hypothetical protein
MIHRLIIATILFSSTQAFGIKPKFATECSTAILNAAALRASEIVEEHSFGLSAENPKVEAPQSASIRVIQDRHGWKVRVYPHGKNMDARYIVEFRVPLGLESELMEGAIAQEGYRTLRSLFRGGVHHEIRVSDENKKMTFEYMVRMISPVEVGSITYKFADENGVYEENTWNVGERQTLN